MEHDDDSIGSGTADTVAFTDAWLSLVVSLGIVLLCLSTVALIIVTLFSYTSGRASDSERSATTLETDLAAFEAELNAAIPLLNSVIDEVNNTLSDDIWELMDALNMTTADGQSIAQQLSAQVAALESLASMKIATINSVYGDTVMHNINLIGFGITVVPDYMLHNVKLVNDGVIIVTTTDTNMISVNTTNQIASVENKCVNTINSMLAITNNINLVGTGMIAVTSDSMTNSITVDGSAMANVLSNSQIIANAQAIQITSLQATVIGLQQQTDGLQMSIDMLYDIVNTTEISFNATLEELVDRVASLMMRRDLLQQQLDQLQFESITQIGSIIPWGGAEIISNASVIPDKYVLCNGAELNIVDYPLLYDAIGASYCGGNCTFGTFAVPDLRGRVPVGKAASGTFSGSVGSTVGEETHTLSGVEMGAHFHGADSATETPYHVHLFALGMEPTTFSSCTPGSTATNWNRVQAAGYGGPDGCPSADCHGNAFGFGTGGGHTHSITAFSQGSSAAHNNIQPSAVVQYLIRVEA